MRTIFLVSLLGAVAAVLLCTAPLFAETGSTHSQSVREAVPTPELAIELGLPETVEMQTVVIKPVPLCQDNETPQVCDFTDPCTGQRFWDATCCPTDTQGTCRIGITLNRCITGVSAVCLGIVSP